MTSISDGTTTVTVEEILSAKLTRPLYTSVTEADGEATVSRGVPGALSGTIVYLCATLADALAVDALYRAGDVTLSTGGALDGFDHCAVDTLELAAEKAVPGHPSKWLATVQIKEK